MLTTHIKKLARGFTLYVLKVYTNSVRSLLEYTVPVWQSIPGYLSDKIESIQKRVLKIMFPSANSYSDALELARMKNLKMKDLNHPLHPLLPIRLDNRNITTCRTKRTEDFFTFKYF